ncbi:MAG: helix-turn-helix domain-containing protein [Gemmatimonadaceae bacterium]|nr:helix-turn-helix domain-containing protein [Gemmatimonadaceae bacterium]
MLRSHHSRAHLQRHAHADGWWELATQAAAPAVADCVATYVGYEECSRTPLRRFEVPHPNVTVIVNLGDPLDVHAPALEPAGARFGSFVAGLFDTVAVTASTGRSRGIELNLSPLATWRLLGVPMHALVNRAVHLGDLLGRDATQLECRLRDAATWDARFDLLDVALARRLERARAMPATVAWAWRAVMREPGAAPVHDITRELQWSRRRLAATFREHVGLTPKALARVVRFDRVVRQVRALPPGESPVWSRLAFGCGYADQPHLVREFREFASLTPTEFHRRLSAILPGVSAP